MRVPSQSRGAFEESGGRRDTAAGLHATRRALQFVGNRIVRADRRVPEVPGPTLRIDGRFGHRRQRAVDAPPVRQRHRPVRGRPHQRMPEPDPRADLGQPRFDRGFGRIGGQAQQRGGRPQ
jgi:hypothetical protein